jgi:hypothetical protein
MTEQFPIETRTIIFRVVFATASLCGGRRTEHA